MGWLTSVLARSGTFSWGARWRGSLNNKKSFLTMADSALDRRLAGTRGNGAGCRPRTKTPTSSPPAAAATMLSYLQNPYQAVIEPLDVELGLSEVRWINVTRRT